MVIFWELHDAVFFKFRSKNIVPIAENRSIPIIRTTDQNCWKKIITADEEKPPHTK